MQEIVEKIEGGRGTYEGDKTPVQTFTERRGKTRDDTNETLKTVSKGEIVKEHRFVNHSKEYAKDSVHVNTAENRHGFLRAWLIKFRGVSKHYLRNYISLFELLFNSKEISIHHSVPDGLGG